MRIPQKQRYIETCASRELKYLVITFIVVLSLDSCSLMYICLFLCSLSYFFFSFLFLGAEISKCNDWRWNSVNWAKTHLWIIRRGWDCCEDKFGHLGITEASSWRRHTFLGNEFTVQSWTPSLKTSYALRSGTTPLHYHKLSLQV